MHAWLGILEFLGLLVLLVALFLVALALRQRWLARLGATFECSLRNQASAPSTGWALGAARYNQSSLEWFRFFSLALRPRLAIPRSAVRVLETRHPELVEAVALGAHRRVIRVETVGGDPRPEWELAMSQESLTGLLSWLEAAPPGVRRTE